MLKVEDSPLEASPLTVGDFLHDWLAHIRTRVRPSTYDGYAFLIQHHALPALGHLPLGKVHPLHIEQVYARMTSPGYEGPRGQVSAKTAGNLQLSMGAQAPALPGPSHHVLRLSTMAAMAIPLDLPSIPSEPRLAPHCPQSGQPYRSEEHAHHQ